MALRSTREEWLRKYERLQGLKALLAEYNAMPEPDVAYIKGLNARIRRVQNQLNVMSDVGNENIEHGHSETDL